MRVLLTGSDGYLGRITAPVLAARGHDVVGLDTGFYRAGWLYNDNADVPETITKDVRDLEAADLDGFDAIVHMAELSNDPIGDLIGDVTYQINHLGSVRLAELAKEAGVERFVYMSSCSVYGAADGVVDETSPVGPLTSYARCKALVEQDVTPLAGDDFSPTFLRNATAFGASPRMRFDIVLNNLAGLAWTTGAIAMTSDGTPWRPLVHGLDIAGAIGAVLASPRDAVHNQVLNVGSDENNYTVRQIAEAIAAEFPNCELSFGEPGPDNRSYKVAFDRIGEVLPDFRCEWNAAKGAAQLHAIFQNIALDSDTFTGRGHTRLKQLQYLMDTRQVDDALFWRNS
jgi:nucleoside-diphosphate-sugar epimerase